VRPPDHIVPGPERGGGGRVAEQLSDELSCGALARSLENAMCSAPLQRRVAEWGRGGDHRGHRGDFMAVRSPRKQRWQPPSGSAPHPGSWEANRHRQRGEMQPRRQALRGASEQPQEAGGAIAPDLAGGAPGHRAADCTACGAERGPQAADAGGALLGDAVSVGGAAGGGAAGGGASGAARGAWGGRGRLRAPSSRSPTARAGGPGLAPREPTREPRRCCRKAEEGSAP
jgi:hypothetical protein